VPQSNVIIEICPILLFTVYITKNIAYHITEELIFYADKIVVMGIFKNLRVFNFAILLKSLRKFDARDIYTCLQYYWFNPCQHKMLSCIGPGCLCEVLLLITGAVP